MPSLVTQAAEGLARRVFTVDEVLRMQELGIIAEDENFELVEGEIVPMQAKNPPHELVKLTLTRRLARALPDDLWLGVETSIYMSSRTFLEPDLSIFASSKRADYIHGPDLLLAIEVSSSTLAYDRGLKASLYARYGVRELWVIDVETRRTYVYTRPDNGVWGSIVTREPEENLTIVEAPDFSIRLADL